MLVGPSKCLEQIINNIIGRGWAKYREAKCWGKQLMCELDTDKSRYFVITEFNNCFIIWSPSLSFLMNILGPFSCNSDCKKEKSTVSFTHEQNIICSQTQLDGIAHKKTIICRQLFAGHVVGSWPVKREKNLLRMII